MEYITLLSELKKVESDEPFIITIDGPAGSGKTTLAQKLVNDLSDAQVIHMDDLYEGWNDPLSAKLTARVISQLLQPFTMKLLAKYQSFNWKLNRFDVMKSVHQSKYLIIEGVGSGQKSFDEYFNILIWIQIDPQVGFDRVITRDGEQVRNEMLKFLVDQNNHFLAESTKFRADYTLDGAP
jgi:uridine kinase